MVPPPEQREGATGGTRSSSAVQLNRFCECPIYQNPGDGGVIIDAHRRESLRAQANVFQYPQEESSSGLFKRFFCVLRQDSHQNFPESSFLQEVENSLDIVCSLSTRDEPGLIGVYEIGHLGHESCCQDLSKEF